MTKVTERKSCLICFVSFICENTHKIWYKNLWNWLCYWNYLTFWPLPRAKFIFAVARPMHVSNSHTSFGWIWSNDSGGDITDRRRDRIWFLNPKHPQITPLGHDPGNRIKSCLICFVSFICEYTHKIWYKHLWNWFVIEIKWYMTIWPFPRAPGGGAKKISVARPIHMSNSVLLLLLLGVGGDDDDHYHYCHLQYKMAGLCSLSK